MLFKCHTNNKFNGTINVNFKLFNDFEILLKYFWELKTLIIMCVKLFLKPYNYNYFNLKNDMFLKQNQNHSYIL